MKYWLKAIGVSGANLKGKETFGFREEIKFPPSTTSIQVQDQLIAFATGTHLLIGAFEVLIAPFWVSKEEQDSNQWSKQFPKVAYTENLTKTFSDEWGKLNLFDVEKKFIERGGKEITNTPSNDLKKAINQNSYLELSEDFATYLMNKMKQQQSGKILI